MKFKDYNYERYSYEAYAEAMQPVSYTHLTLPTIA